MRKSSALKDTIPASLRIIILVIPSGTAKLVSYIVSIVVEVRSVTIAAALAEYPYHDDVLVFVSHVTNFKTLSVDAFPSTPFTTVLEPLPLFILEPLLSLKVDVSSR